MLYETGLRNITHGVISLLPIRAKNHTKNDWFQIRLSSNVHGTDTVCKMSIRLQRRSDTILSSITISLYYSRILADNNRLLELERGAPCDPQPPQWRCRYLPFQSPIFTVAVSLSVKTSLRVFSVLMQWMITLFRLPQFLEFQQ